MSGLRIGAFHLPPKDVAYLRALVRLFSYTAKLEWSFVEAAPYTVLVARAQDWALHGGEADFQGLVLRLAAGQDGGDADLIDYPIEPDQLGDWLKMKAAVLAGAAEPDQAQAAAPTAQAAPPVTAEQAQLQYMRFRLRRWPSPAELGGDPVLIRLATILSRKACSAAELAQFTEQPLALCIDFMQALERANVLADAASVDAAAPVPAGPTPEQRSMVKSGLFSSLRRRFGL